MIFDIIIIMIVICYIFISLLELEVIFFGIQYT